MTRTIRCLLALLALVTAGLGCRGQHEGPGEVTRKELAPAAVNQRAERQAEAVKQLAAPARVSGPPSKQVLFGDLHVHTTFSADAFLLSLPLLQGEGAHPPADACDYARFCSQLDFWSINDHSEAISPQHWTETKEAIRQCNAVAGDPKNPDTVAFVGWEWTQVGTTPETHYGHKNVIFRDTADDRVPSRPISALSPQLVGSLRRPAPLGQRLLFPLYDWSNRQRYLDFGVYQAELREVPICPDGVDVHKLPADCTEVASTPDVLFEKLAQWGFDSLVIPHGNTWGLYTPPGSTWDKQLVGAQHDPERQRLIEVYSGHGNSEEYRSWKAIDWDKDGKPFCPEPTKNYEPCCWRAGEIIRSRCSKDTPAQECERRVAEAKLNYINAGAAARLTVPGALATEWKDCGQCRDCFNPAFSMRPGSSVQSALAVTNFDDPAKPRRFRFGLMASSDNHRARGGTGFKEFGRRTMTEAAGARSPEWAARMGQTPQEPKPESISFDATASTLPAFLLVDFERQASFFLTGGLVAVHASGRDRDSIWQALKQREVYGTSGDRILLWFDLLNGPNGAMPMGTEATLGEVPRFRVTAIGAFKQLPGCPDYATTALTPERLQYVCRGECYNPSDTRKRITRVEVVRIRPQIEPGEPMETLIQDPWKRLECPPGDSCVVEFEDPEFLAGGREVVYYVRAIEEPTPAVNAGQLRCEYDAAGNCVKSNPCYGDYRTPFDDDCLAMNEERAWSSPIYVRPVETLAAAGATW